MLSPKLSDFYYELPKERIALYPLPKREDARLLVYEKGDISHRAFKEIGDLLPSKSLLVFNDTKVVHARLIFQRETGARIEVFCLFPIHPHREMSQAMQVQGQTIWECMAGNQKRWKTGEVIELQLRNQIALSARLLKKKGKNVVVEFSWEPSGLNWAEVLEQAGKLPLPPYIDREAGMEDEIEYQTVYARHDGAVAAPTAGLHFTESILNEIKHKGIRTTEVTLHVGAGTFQPVQEEEVLKHPMHNEQIVFDRKNIESLITHENSCIAVGTTSLRALESLYWFGVQLVNDKELPEFFIPKLYPYSTGKKVTKKESLSAILNWMNERKLEKLWGHTEIFLFPSYEFRMTDGLITNFHQPNSTLLMLIAAFAGHGWKRIYAEALDNDYRFLSYGDASLLLP